MAILSKYNISIGDDDERSHRCPHGCGYVPNVFGLGRDVYGPCSCERCMIRIANNIDDIKRDIQNIRDAARAHRTPPFTGSTYCKKLGIPPAFCDDFHDDFHDYFHDYFHDAVRLREECRVFYNK